jgi:hypothetical protein
MLKKGGQIIDNVKKVEKNIINSLNKPPLLNKENQNMEYFVFSHDLLSKNLINETLSFKKIHDKLNDLKKNNYIDQHIYNIMHLKNKYFIDFLDHGIYAKNLGNINGENWVRLTSITTSSTGKIYYDGKNIFKPIKIEGLDSKKDLFITSSIILKVKEYDELSKYVIEDKYRDKSSYYEVKKRDLIIEKIDQLNEEGNIPIVNFEEFKNNINMLLILENIGINSDEYTYKKKEYIENLENERNKPLLYTKEMKDKIAFFKSHIKNLIDNDNSIISIKDIQNLKIDKTEL